MPDESPGNDPQQIWQNQSTERYRMSLEQISQKIRRLHRQARLAALLFGALGVVLCVVFARSAWREPYAIPRAGWAILSLWTLYSAYAAYKSNWPKKSVSDASWSTSVAFYRGELEKQRDLTRDVWRRSGLTFCFLGVALIILPGLILALRTPRLLVNGVPFFAMLGIWFVMYHSMRKRKLRKLQREIDELTAMEGQS